MSSEFLTRLNCPETPTDPEAHLPYSSKNLNCEGPRNVVIEFMKDKIQFEREKMVRVELCKDTTSHLAAFVCPIYQALDWDSMTESNKLFREALENDLTVKQSFELSNYTKVISTSSKSKRKQPYSDFYRYAVVMLGGDMDFQTILEKENVSIEHAQNVP